MNKILNFVARLLMAQIFLISGIGKITGYAGTQAYMASMGVPGGLLPLVILLEVGGGLGLIIGCKIRWVALALAVFSLVSAFFFHTNFADQMQMINFMKNLAIAGGLLLLFVHGAGAPSVDEHMDKS